MYNLDISYRKKIGEKKNKKTKTTYKYVAIKQHVTE